MVASSLCSAEDWTRFRGANGRGVITHSNVPFPWKADDIAWQRDLPGYGHGSPVVYGNKIFVLSADPDNASRHVLAFDLKSGKQLWRRNYQSEPHIVHKLSSYASSTPCVNDKAVFFTWATPTHVILKKFSHDGKELKSVDLGTYQSQHGYGASPVLFDNYLVLFNSQQSEQLGPGMKPGVSRVQAFDADSLELKWERTRTTVRACYGVPTRFTDPLSGKDALLFANTGDGIFALELKTGAPLWNRKVFDQRCVSSPIIVGNLAIGTDGSGGGGSELVAVKLDSPNHETVFHIDSAAPYVPTPVATDKLLFMWSDQGIVSCINVANGKVLWKKRIGGDTSSSPLIVGDKLIGISHAGVVSVLHASSKVDDWVGSVELGQGTQATPVVTQEYALFRTHSQLICVGQP